MYVAPQLNYWYLKSRDPITWCHDLGVFDIGKEALVFDHFHYSLMDLTLAGEHTRVLATLQASYPVSHNR